MIFKNPVIQNFSSHELLKDYQISESKKLITKSLSLDYDIDFIKTLSTKGIILPTKILRFENEYKIIQDNFDGILLDLLKDSTKTPYIIKPLSEFIFKLFNNEYIIENNNIFNIVFKEIQPNQYEFFVFNFNRNSFNSLKTIKNEKKLIKILDQYENFLSPFTMYKLNLNKSEIITLYQSLMK